MNGSILQGFVTQIWKFHQGKMDERSKRLTAIKKWPWNARFVLKYRRSKNIYGLFLYLLIQSYNSQSIVMSCIVNLFKLKFTGLEIKVVFWGPERQIEVQWNWHSKAKRHLVPKHHLWLDFQVGWSNKRNTIWKLKLRIKVFFHISLKMSKFWYLIKYVINWFWK